MNGMLTCAEHFNVAEVMENVDGVFFTGGEDISPSLFAKPQAEANHGEEINATRDISDYTLMSYCIANDVPTFAACRGMQMMSIVSGADFIQDIPDYYASLGAEYNDLHRMPADAPNRDYARHDVDIIDKDSWVYKIVGDTVLENVSSWHHQAVKSVEGTDLTVVAKTTDNGVDIIEGVENKNNTFCVGMQFHPENDCSLVLYQGKEAPCDFDTCLGFFELWWTPLPDSGIQIHHNETKGPAKLAGPSFSLFSPCIARQGNLQSRPPWREGGLRLKKRMCAQTDKNCPCLADTGQ